MNFKKTSSLAASIITAALLLSACGPSVAEKQMADLQKQEASAAANELPAIAQKYRDIAKAFPKVRERALKEADRVDARYLRNLQTNEQLYRDAVQKYGN